MTSHAGTSGKNFITKGEGGSVYGISLAVRRPDRQA
jgi:hypothetical protein